MTRKEITELESRLQSHRRMLPDAATSFTTFQNLLDIVDLILQFASKHLIKDNKIRPIGWRVWLYVPALKLVFKLVKEIKKAL